jgi:hypothetical protein
VAQLGRLGRRLRREHDRLRRGNSATRVHAEGWPRLATLTDPAADVEIDPSRSTY